MSFARSLALFLGLLLIGSLPTAAQQKLFSHPVVAKDAERYESYLKGVFKAVTPQAARTQREAGLKLIADGGSLKIMTVLAVSYHSARLSEIY